MPENKMAIWNEQLFEYFEGNIEDIYLKLEDLYHARK
jgi:hypothetical protein